MSVEVEEGIGRAALYALPSLFDQNRLKCWLVQVFHAGIPACPFCQHALDGKALRSFLDLRITSCAACGAKVKITKGTLIHATKIPLEQFVVMAALIEIGSDRKVIAEALGLSPSTVSDWIRRLKS